MHGKKITDGGDKSVPERILVVHGGKHATRHGFSSEIFIINANGVIPDCGAVSGNPDQKPFAAAVVGSSRLRTFPVGVRGKSATISKYFGIL